MSPQVSIVRTLGGGGGGGGGGARSYFIIRRGELETSGRKRLRLFFKGVRIATGVVEIDREPVYVSRQRYG